MHSKYSVKELAIGTTLPVKLRLTADRQRLGSYGAIKQLTEVFLQRVAHKEPQSKPLLQDQPHRKKTNKQNVFRASEDAAKIAGSKSRRVNSQKYPNIVRNKKDRKPADKYFSEFFDLFKGAELPEDLHFTPYRMQQRYKGKYISQQSSREGSVRKRSAQGVGEGLKKGTISGEEVSKWQTWQESLGSSFLEEGRNDFV